MYGFRSILPDSLIQVIRAVENFLIHEKVYSMNHKNIVWKREWTCEPLTRARNPIDTRGA